MPETAIIIPVIPDEMIQEESPWGEALLGRFRDGLYHLHAALAGLDTSTRLQRGTIDSLPLEDTANSTFTDSNPTSFAAFGEFGHVYTPDLFVGLSIEMTSGAASGTRYRIVGHDLGSSPTDTGESNFEVVGLMDADGVLGGDTYEVIGHAHNTFDSEEISVSNDPDDFIQTGDHIFFQGSCPSGYTRVTTYDDKLLKVSTGSVGTNGGTTTHTHVQANTGTMQSGPLRFSCTSDIANGWLDDVNGQHVHVSIGSSTSGPNNRLEKGMLICTKD